MRRPVGVRVSERNRLVREAESKMISQDPIDNKEITWHTF